MKSTLLLCFPFFIASIVGTAASLESIEERTKSMELREGFFNYYWDEDAGKVWLEIDQWNEEFLYVNSLAAGVGSNDIGLDRAQLGNTRIARFERVGPTVLLMQPNYAFRAESENVKEREAVELAFAHSALAGFEIAAESDGRVLIDFTPFLMRDTHGVGRVLESSGQGKYSLDEKRSAMYLKRTRNFPFNSEWEATLTFKGDPKGAYIREVTPSPDSVTVRQHHSFVQLPDENYEKRVFDVRSGYFPIGYRDYATPIDRPLKKQFVRRHRLEKRDPKAPMSEAKEPIVYYVDSGAPEPIRSALVEGASWWNDAFEAIGFENAFQVKLLPEDADPMDVRYNVINWVHRSTRGWSYGASVTDPRTGEIIKGHVTLGSLRVRQDYLIAQGLLSPFDSGNTDTSKMRELALARLRQLSAHEVGHTLGIAHNFAASMQNRASVMDYPHPFVGLDREGGIDLSNAYDTGIGAWDKTTIAYGYSDFVDGSDETAELDGILESAFEDGLEFISDRDARPAGGAHPNAHLWDNGKDAAEELMRVLEVRKQALARFSESSIPIGTPYSELSDVLVPLYLSHRYQVDAASKVLGGLHYTYAVRGDGQMIQNITSPELQRSALDSLLYAISPEVLTLPESLLRLIPPPAFGNSRGRESFNTRTGLTFDPIAAAETAADFAIRFLLHPERAARLIEYNARDSENPSLTEVIDRLLKSTWKLKGPAGLEGEVGRVVDSVALQGIMRLAADANAPNQARALADSSLRNLKNWLERESKRERTIARKAHFQFGAIRIGRFLEAPDAFEFVRTPDLPAGSPIGMNCACGNEFNASLH